MESIFAKERQKKQKKIIWKSSGMVSVGIMILIVSVGFVFDSGFDVVRAEVKVDSNNVFSVSDSSLHNKIELPKAPIDDAVPNKIEINDLGIKLPIVPQIVENGVVKVSETKANYLVGSGVVGESHNIVIFAHKRRGMFVNLINAKIGSKLVIKSNSLVGEYEIVSAYETRNNDMTVVSPDSFYGVTLYTCNRWDDSHRFVVRAREVRTYRIDEN